MLSGSKMFAVEDKAVSTSNEMFTNINSGDLCAVTVEKFVNNLINNKLTSIREMESIDDFDDSETSMYYVANQREKEPPDKRESRERKHCPHCPKHAKKEERREQRSSISKVQKWSDDQDVETSFYARSDEDLRTSPQERNFRATIEEEQRPASKKRKRKKKRRKMSKKVSQIDPEDLPKRARWTIIITSGLLIITCMFLVGITLRMAPVIDQMVRTQNEELMNSLNRDTDANPAYYSVDMWEKSPQERAKTKYGQ